MRPGAVARAGIITARADSKEAVAKGCEVRAAIEGRVGDSEGQIFLDKDQRPEAAYSHNVTITTGSGVRDTSTAATF